MRGVIIGSALMLAACAPVSAPGASINEEQTPEKAVQSPVPTVRPPAAASESPDFSGQLAHLSFAGNGDTFLERIEEARAGLGDVSGHRYVELEDDRGQIWQGEELRSAQSQVVLLQPLQGGGKRGVRLDMDPGMGLDAIGGLLSRAEAGMDTPAGGTVEIPRPDVTIEFVRARLSSDTWTFDVTVSHADTGWEDYADGWHVETAEGAILGTRILLHPHVNEQPFTRSLSGVAVPTGVDEVHIRAHDLVSGYGLETVVIPLAKAVQTEQYEVIR